MKRVRLKTMLDYPWSFELIKSVDAFNNPFRGIWKQSDVVGTALTYIRKSND